MKALSSAGLFILGALSTFYEFRGTFEKDSAFGEGGVRVDTFLPKLRNDVHNEYFLLPQNKRETLASQMTGLHGPLAALGSWDVEDMFKENKSRWSDQLSAIAPNNKLPDTLSYDGLVFSVAEVNYILYGMLQREAWIQGVMTGVTNYFSTLSIATLYRATFGGIVSALSKTSVKYETATGKVAFVDHGWELTLASVQANGFLDTTPPIEASLGNGASATGQDYVSIFGMNRLRFNAGTDGPNDDFLIKNF